MKLIIFIQSVTEDKMRTLTFSALTLSKCQLRTHKKNFECVILVVNGYRPMLIQQRNKLILLNIYISSNYIDFSFWISYTEEKKKKGIQFTEE